MQHNIDNIIELIFKKKVLKDVSEKELQELVDQYPYFTAGRFLLAKKLIGNGTNTAEDEISVAALYFYNPLWLHWLLTEQTTEINEKPVISQPVNEQHLVDNDKKTFEEIEGKQDTEIAIESEKIPEEAQNANVLIHHEANKQETNTSIHNTAVASAINTGDKSEIIFEPYHTIDYFASQGIKLQQEDLLNDKFGKQLKSFTEWLRSMKRLPNPIDTKIDRSTERFIQHNAEQSLDKKEIVTEAMAEVWVKQNNPEKAIEIYKKLSLQNPSKNAYFAARIEQLKAL